MHLQQAALPSRQTADSAHACDCKAGSSPDTHNHVVHCHGCCPQIGSQAPCRGQRDALQWLIAWQTTPAIMCDCQTCTSSGGASCKKEYLLTW